MRRAMSEPLRRTVKIVNVKGLHARAAAKFCKTADQFEAKVLVSKGDLEVDACSIMGLLMLAAAKETEIHIQATGVQAEDAMNAICALVEDGFDEE